MPAVSKFDWSLATNGAPRAVSEHMWRQLVTEKHTLALSRKHGQVPTPKDGANQGGASPDVLLYLTVCHLVHSVTLGPASRCCVLTGGQLLAKLFQEQGLANVGRSLNHMAVNPLREKLFGCAFPVVRPAFAHSQVVGLHGVESGWCKETQSSGVLCERGALVEDRWMAGWAGAPTRTLQLQCGAHQTCMPAKSMPGVAVLRV